MRKKLNNYLLARPKLLLTLLWVFFLLAIIPAIIIAIVNPTMGLFPFWGIIGVPAACALYLRLLYGKIYEQNRQAAKEKREAERAAKNAKRHHHKKR